MGCMLVVVNDMMLDMLVVMVRKDYEDCKRRISQGCEKVKVEGCYKGRLEDEECNVCLMKMMVFGVLWKDIMVIMGVFSLILVRLFKWMKEGGVVVGFQGWCVDEVSICYIFCKCYIFGLIRVCFERMKLFFIVKKMLIFLEFVVNGFLLVF